MPHGTLLCDEVKICSGLVLRPGVLSKHGHPAYAWWHHLLGGIPSWSPMGPAAAPCSLVLPGAAQVLTLVLVQGPPLVDQVCPRAKCVSLR